MIPFWIPPAEKVLIKLGEGCVTPLADRDILKICIWNVFKGQRRQFFEQDFKSLCTEKDFILLQEAVVDSKMPRIWADSFANYEWHLAQSFHYKRDFSSTGVAIGSPWKPTHVDFIRTSTREMHWLTPKLSLFSQYEVAGQKVLFVCTHVLNFVTLRAFTSSLYEIAQKIAPHDGPVILAGDFNTWNFKRYMIMKSVFKDLNLEHLDLEEDGRLLKLDHVFVRGFDVLKAQVHPKIISSDHFPIEIKLKLR